jgi:hypothetical protein
MSRRRRTFAASAVTSYGVPWLRIFRSERRTGIDDSVQDFLVIEDGCGLGGGGQRLVFRGRGLVSHGREEKARSRLLASTNT